MKSRMRVFSGFPVILMLLCTVAWSQATVQIESSQEFERLVELRTGTPVVINASPLRMRINVTVVNKSLWFIDVDSRSNIIAEGLTPQEIKTYRDVIIEQESPLQISVKGGNLTRGLTYKKNLLNSLWLGATGQPIPDINRAIEPLLQEFGPDLLLQNLEQNPQVILSRLIELNLIPSQTTIAQFTALQDYFGKLGGAVSITGALLNSPNQAEAIDQWWLLNMGQRAKLKAINSDEIVLLNEDFSNLDGWNYFFNNNEDASFRTDGILSVSDFGKQQGGQGRNGSWYGAIATKDLSEPLDINHDDFSLSSYCSSIDNLPTAMGLIWIVLLDSDNKPLVGSYWIDNLHEGIGMDSWPAENCPIGRVDFPYNSFLGIYTSERITGEGRTRGHSTVDGTIILRKAGGQLSFFYNSDTGNPLLTSNTGAQGIATKVKISILKYGPYPARDMKVDYLRIIKRK